MPTVTRLDGMMVTATALTCGMLDVLDDLRNDLTRRGFAAINRVAVPLIKAGVGSPPPIGVGLVVLETTGRVSGLPREVPLLATRCDRQINVSTVRSASQWVKNLRARPDAAVWVGGRRREVIASVDPATESNGELDRNDEERGDPSAGVLSVAELVVR